MDVEYKHKVQYYETDKMAIVHHSNYIRWMEEARVDFLEKIGAPFDKLEELGLLCPVTEVSCNYIGMVRFGETVTIRARLEEFNGVKMVVKYTMTHENGEVCCEAGSKHCFICGGRVISLRKKFPEIYEKFVPYIENEKSFEKSK